MPDALAWSFEVITGLPWLEIIRALAPVATAIIALIALKNWKRQDKAKREAEFLVELLDTVHEYINGLSSPLTHAEFVKISVDAYAPTWEGGDRFYKGAIAYIEKAGAEASKKLFATLVPVRPLAVKLESLIAKGQVFGFRGYDQCHADVRNLTWVFARIEALAAAIGSTSMNWENSEVEEFIKGGVNMDVAQLRKHVQDRNLLVIGFVTNTYREIYGAKPLRVPRSSG
jgi:hypothetical protein